MRKRVFALMASLVMMLGLMVVGAAPASANHRDWDDDGWRPHRCHNWDWRDNDHRWRWDRDDWRGRWHDDWRWSDWNWCRGHRHHWDW